MKPTLYLILSAMLLLISACVAPKAVMVEEIPPQGGTGVEVAAVAAEPEKPVEVDDGLRLPDFTAMPGENDLKRGPAVRPSTDVPAAVISRPPTDPPSRPGAVVEP